MEKPAAAKDAAAAEDDDDTSSSRPGETSTTSAVVTPQTQRGLSPRHVQLMTIAGGIGVGLFVGVGSVLAKTGPLPLILGYLIYGVAFIWPTTLNVAEMVAWLPIRGSIYELAARFVDPALGFAMGWTYFFAGAMLVCTEYSAVATVMGYWNVDGVNPAVWIAMALSVCYFLNMVAVKWYGESEFIMGSTKVLLLLGLMLATFITMVGGNPLHDAYGFRTWSNGDFVHAYYTDGAVGIFLSISISVRYAVFTIGGPDFISLAAGEIRNPRQTIPRVANLIVHRILFFYVVGILAVGVICHSRDPRLLGAIANPGGSSSDVGAAASPWVVGLLSHGIAGFLPGFINFLILLSGWSCGNAFLYASSRTLYSLAQDGHAPRVFLRCTTAGVPWVCVTAVTLISLLSFLVASNEAGEVFSWFLELTTVSLVVNFTAMSWVFVGWRRALKAQRIRQVSTERKRRWTSLWFDRGAIAAETVDQGQRPMRTTTTDVAFSYIAPCASWTPYLCLVLGSTISLFIGFDIFSPWSTKGFITSYFGLGWFVGMFVFWKVYKRTTFVNPGSVDLYADGRKQAIDYECRLWEEGWEQERQNEELRKKSMFVRTWGRFWGD